MEEVKQKSWFGRNWLWVLPVGGCLTLIVLAVLGIGALFFGVTSMLKSSTPYEYAIKEAFNNEHVVSVLGKPIKTNGIVSGNISLKNDDGEANFKIPIVGSNGNASIVVIAHKTSGKWIYETLYVLIKETHEEINLLNQDLEGI